MYRLNSIRFMRTNCKQLLFAVIIALAITPFAPCSAQLNFKMPFRSNVDADAKKTYALTDKHGPWLIVCASFAGDMGKIQARDLVYELRKEYNLEAYMYAKAFDHTGKIRGIGYKDDQWDNKGEPVPVEMRAQHSQQFVEFAVVVGNFPSADDKQAQDTVERIKRLHPRTLHVAPGVETSQRMAVLREIQKRLSRDEETQKMGPMRAAFVIPNPYLPESYFQQPILDDFVYGMNKDLTYSLLKCRGKYSVRVATFRGLATFDRTKMDREEQLFQYKAKSGQAVDSKLAKAMDDANKMTVALRKMGYEAYEFHDRNESYVCVGSFDWIFALDDNGQARLNHNGEPVTNPEVNNIILEFKATPKDFPGLAPQLRPKTIPSLRGTGITFDLQPLPVEVPLKPGTNLFGR